MYIFNAALYLQQGRSDAQPVIIIITDGRSQDQAATRRAADALREAGVKVDVLVVFLQ